MGGGTRRGHPWLYVISGLSPRGRGNLHEVAQIVTAGRSIPAWAGEPCMASALALQA